jgi:hypothetical protein
MQYADILRYVTKDNEEPLTKVALKNGEVMRGYFIRENQTDELTEQNKWALSISGSSQTTILYGDEVLCLAPE